MNRQTAELKKLEAPQTMRQLSQNTLIMTISAVRARAVPIIRKNCQTKDAALHSTTLADR